MTSGSFTFLGYCLDPADRKLHRDGTPIELNSRYFDALALLVREAGQLVTKDRFLDEVWRGVPVTDEALTQCIKTLRRQLGDQAGAPRFIETVPKHGYRFIAPVGEAGPPPAPPAEPVMVESHRHSKRAQSVVLLGLAGTMGGGAAGLVGGLLYGFATASGPAAARVGEASALLVLIFLTLVAGLVGGVGVSFGIGVSTLVRRRTLLSSVAGGAFGGLAVGAIARLIGLDAFNLLLGQSPGDITGGAEGALLGAAAGLGAWFALREPAAAFERAIAPAALAGGMAGLLIPLLGGQMMGGSLDLLARQFPASHLRLEQIGALFGESGFGMASQLVTGVIEGCLFAAGIAGAMALAVRSRNGR